MQIRDAEPRDAAAIAAIYNDAVANTTAVWHSRQVTAAERAAWIAQRQTDGFPVLVAESGESALGYATYGPFRAFEGYRHTAELSIYVDARARGGGIGAALLQALIDTARQRGIHVLVGCVDAENAGSIRLHERFGFTQSGHMHQVGRKFDRWLDLAILERVLD